MKTSWQISSDSSMPSRYCFPKVAKHNLGVDQSNQSTAVPLHSQQCMGDAKLCHRQELSCESSLCDDKASKNQTPCCPVRLPLQPLAKLPLYTVDRKRCTKSPAAVNPAGAPFHVPGPRVWPLSFLPRGEGAACPMGHAPYSGDPQMVPRGFLLQRMLQPPCCQPPTEHHHLEWPPGDAAGPDCQDDSWGTSLRNRAGPPQHPTACVADSLVTIVLIRSQQMRTIMHTP